MTVEYTPAAPKRYASPKFYALPAIGDGDLVLRNKACRDGSERLHHAIEDLVKRTAAGLDIPAAHRARPLDFARAYLGMEVRR